MAFSRRGGVSSLLSAARSGYDKQVAYQDASAAQEFDLSAKTKEDLDKYMAYLQGRIKQTSDPSKALTLQNKAITATRGYTSKEIFRATQSVLTGNGSEQDKLSAIAQLHQAASANGDDNLAQTLYGAYNTQVLKIQNQAIADQNAAEAAAGKAQQQSEADYRDQLDLADQNIEYVKRQLGRKEIKNLRGDVIKGENGAPASFNDAMHAFLRAKLDVLDEAIKSGTLSRSDARSFTNEYNKLLQSGELEKRQANVQAESFGLKPTNVIYTTDASGNTVAKEEQAASGGIQVFRDSQGNIHYLPVPTTSSKSVTESAAFKKTKADLEKRGLLVREDNGQLVVNDNGTERTLYIDPQSGQARYTGVDENGKTFLGRYNNGGFEGISTQEQEAELKAVESGKNPAAQASKSFASDLAAKLPIGNVNPAGVKKGLLGFAPRIIDSVVNIGRKKQAEAEAAAKRAAEVAATVAANKQREAQALRSIQQFRATPSVPVGYNANSGLATNAIGPVAVPAAVRTAAFTPGTNSFNQTFFRPYLDPFKGVINPNHLAIISAGTNYGGTVQQLRDAGVSDQMLARDSAYDKALRAASSFGQFH